MFEESTHARGTVRKAERPEGGIPELIRGYPDNHSGVTPTMLNHLLNQFSKLFIPPLLRVHLADRVHTDNR